MKDVLKEVSGYLKTNLERTFETTPRPLTLRVSGFPYCPLKHLFYRYNPTLDEVSFDSVYYTTVGTITHSALQRWLGFGGQILGDWHCLSCANKTKMSFSNVCKKCGSEMMYDEIVIRLGNISGHIDCVYRDKKGRYWVIDYKTSSVYAVTQGDSLPYHHNTVQIKSYCALLEKQYGIKVEGWILIYLARDSPRMVHKPVGKLMKMSEKRAILTHVFEWGRQFSRVLKVTRKEELQEIIDMKACDSYDTYMKHYHSPFSECPLSPICFSKRLRPTMLSVMDGKTVKIEKKKSIVVGNTL